MNVRALIVAVGVPEPHDVGFVQHDHSILVKTKPRDQFEAFMENRLLVHDAVTIGVLQNADPVGGRAVVGAGLEDSGLFPRLRHAGTASIRIFGRLRNPKAPASIPVCGDRRGDERLRSDHRDRKSG